MGMYTEFVFVGKVRGDAPAEVIQALTAMCYSDGDKILPAINHEFFQSDRATWMFQCNSYYHTPMSVSNFKFDKIGEHWNIIVRCDLKNYSSEIQNFVDWVTPYLDADEGDHLGWEKYEEETIPTLLFHPNNWRKPTFPDLET